MRLDLTIVPLTPRRAFRISRGEKRTVRNVFIRLSAEGVAGYGEASPNAFYAEKAESIVATLGRARPFLERFPPPEDPAGIARLMSELGAVLALSPATRCALDLACWDWLGRARGKSVSELALGHPPQAITTFCTIGLCGPEELDARLAEVAGFPRVKVKSDAAADLDFARRIARRSGADIALDANCAWPPERVAALSREAAEMGALFLEQPLPPEGDDAMPAILAASALPILADESCVAAEDVARMPGRFDGFNIKLVKCGGLTPALAMLAEGRRLGLRTMTGCMLESSLLIAAGAVVAAGCDYADLDGAWLLAEDPWTGLTFERGVLIPSGRPGFGVEPPAGLFRM